MKQLTGTVINTKMAKTAVIEVLRKWTHPIYKKPLLKGKNTFVIV